MRNKFLAYVEDTQFGVQSGNFWTLTERQEDGTKRLCRFELVVDASVSPSKNMLKELDGMKVKKDPSYVQRKVIPYTWDSSISLN